LTTPEIYQEAVRDVKLFLDGRQSDLSSHCGSEWRGPPKLRSSSAPPNIAILISTVEQLHEKQRIAAVEGDDADVFGYHFENGMLAVNLFHMRGGRVLDRREFFWEDLPEFENSPEEASRDAEPASGHVGVGALARPVEQRSTTFDPSQFFSQFLTQLYIGQPYVPRNVYVPVDFEDREALEEVLSEQLAGEGSRATRVHITVPSRGDKRSLIDLAANNAKQLYDQRFRVMKPNARAIQEALQDALGLPETAAPHRVLRHFSHSRRRDCRLNGGVGGRPHEEVRLPQIHHSNCKWSGRLCFHARGRHSPLQAHSRRKEGNAEPHSH